MIVFRCGNKFINRKDELKECGRFLGAVSEDVAESLKKDHCQQVVFRCPQCGTNRFVSIHGDGNGSIVQETMLENRIDGDFIDHEVIPVEQLV